MVGATGFEPATTHTPSECATRLRHAPAQRATATPTQCIDGRSGRQQDRLVSSKPRPSPPREAREDALPPRTHVADTTQKS